MVYVGRPDSDIYFVDLFINSQISSLEFFPQAQQLEACIERVEIITLTEKPGLFLIKKLGF